MTPTAGNGNRRNFYPPVEGNSSLAGSAQSFCGVFVCRYNLDFFTYAYAKLVFVSQIVFSIQLALSADNG